LHINIEILTDKVKVINIVLILILNLSILFSLRGAKNTLAMSATPEQVLEKVGERKINYPFEEVVHDLLALGAIGSSAGFQAFDDGVHFGLTSSLFDHLLQFFVQLVSAGEVVVNGIQI
jgi:hypothetical protein